MRGARSSQNDVDVLARKYVNSLACKSNVLRKMYRIHGFKRAEKAIEDARQINAIMGLSVRL